MGLDFGFFRDGEALFYLDRHDEFFDLFLAQDAEQVDPECCDFHVDMRVIDGVMADIREGIQSYGLIEANFPNQVPESFWLLDARKTPIEILLPYYLLLTQILRDEIDQHGTLICGWWG